MMNASNGSENAFSYSAYAFGQSITVTICSLIGNTTVLYVLSSPKFWKEPIFRYMYIATIFDTLNAMSIWVANYPNFFLMNESLFSCELLQIIITNTGAYSNWINVGSSINTYIMVSWPMKYKSFKSKKNQYIICLVLFFVLLVLNIPYGFYLRIIPGEGCLVRHAFALLNFRFLYVIIIPGLLMILLSILMYREIIKKKKTISQSKLKKEKRVFKIILTTNILFIIFNVPYFIVYILTAYSYFHSFYYLNLANLMAFFYCSLNVFIYAFSNTLFRKSFTNLIIFKEISKLKMQIRS